MRPTSSFGPWFWDMIPQSIVRSDSALLVARREPVTPWGTEAALAVTEWTHAIAAGSLMDAIARACCIQRRLPAAAGPAARDVRRAIRWRAFHAARTAFGGPVADWRWRVHPVVEAAESWPVTEEAVRLSTSRMKVEAVRRLLLGFDARPQGRVASAEHVAARWSAASGLVAPSGRGGSR